MAWNPCTESGYNMYDMLSCMQKSIRRGKYNLAAFSANELKIKFRRVMWNRLFVISSEDCFGVVSKELLALYKCDTEQQDDKYIGQAVALLCKALKSRDACYFSCNFVLASRNPREITFNNERLVDFCTNLIALDEKAFESLTKNIQYDLFGFEEHKSNEEDENCSELANSCVSEMSTYDRAKAEIALKLQIALEHRDMDEIGYYMDKLRYTERKLLWNVFIDYAIHNAKEAYNEITALSEIDSVVNRNKKEKDEIFISKAAVVLLYACDNSFESIKSSEIVDYYNTIDWTNYEVKPITECVYKGELPEFVYDCHTLKGKRLGKTDWDMTITEQAALYVLRKAYFDEASWIYTYEQDYENNVLDDKGMEPIREFAKSHEVNPVPYIPYN